MGTSIGAGQSVAYVLAWASMLLPVAVLVVHFIVPKRLRRLHTALLFIATGPGLGWLTMRLIAHVTHLLEATPQTPARDQAVQDAFSLAMMMTVIHQSGILILVLLPIYGLAALARWLLKTQLAQYQEAFE